VGVAQGKVVPEVREVEEVVCRELEVEVVGCSVVEVAQCANCILSGSSLRCTGTVTCTASCVMTCLPAQS
jgi:hypothetical protein